MAESKIPVDVPRKPLTALSTPGVGKGSMPVAGTSQTEIWAIAKGIWGDEIPENTCLAIWGSEVVDARGVDDCPLCGYAGDIFLLCAYHQYRQCECGSILGIHQCKCEEEN